MVDRARQQNQTTQNDRWACGFDNNKNVMPFVVQREKLSVVMQLTVICVLVTLLLGDALMRALIAIFPNVKVS